MLLNLAAASSKLFLVYIYYAETVLTPVLCQRSSKVYKSDGGRRKRDSNRESEGDADAAPPIISPFTTIHGWRYAPCRLI